ncbi:Uncharacterized protein PRO82_000988 [Candidatus Protochlamydia amoebophila]|nr:Uncharacterized protein [Candidatus Protochlamydia amoebophila]
MFKKVVYQRRSLMPQLSTPISEKDHILGNLNAPVVLVEYGDYQCKTCALTHPIVKQLLKEMRGQLCFAFRHFPLKNSHPLAFIASQAAEAAALQNKFWQMHECLYHHHSALSLEAFPSYAEEIQLNIKLFNENLQNPSLISYIEENFCSGLDSGVNGTPCFFINKERYDGDRSYDTLLSALKNAVN